MGMLAGCAQYYNRADADIQQTSKDLTDCRMKAAQGGAQQIYSAAQLEIPCMVGKGYNLSYTPPPERIKIPSVIDMVKQKIKK